MDKSDCDILVADTEHASVSATLQDQAIVRPEKSDATVQEGAVPQDGGDSEKNVLKEATCDDGKSISTIKELEVNQAINIPSSPLREVPKSSIECKEIEENSLLEQKNDVIFSSNTSVTEISPEPKSPSVTSLNISKSPTASAVNDFSDILSGKLNVVTQTSDSSKVSDSANMETKAQKPNPVESPEKKSLPVFDSTQQITKSIFSSLFSSNSQMAQASDVESSSSPTVENNKLFESKTEAQSATKAFANDTSVLDGNATCQTGDASPAATTEPVQPSDVGPIAKSQNAESDTSKEIPMVISETAGEASRAPTSEDAVVLGCIPLKIATESVPTNILYTAMTKPQVTIATVNVLSKVEVKHPPIATKGMKKENRKSLITTPPLPGGKTGKSKSNSPNSKSKKKRPPPKEDGQQDGRNDFYCWVCHREGEVLCCELCPRVFHARCLNMNKEPEGDWFCPECEKITDAECKETQSRAMSLLSIEQFSLLLKYVVQRMKLAGSEPFLEPVDTKMFPDYPDYVFHPMDLSTIEKNIRKYKYGCPEAFLTEFKWVIHNCIIYNSVQSKLTQIAKQMLKVAERELNEIEVCPECYLNSCRKRDNWFCEPCKELHPLVWAKLQGFPHWPAKALRIEKGSVDVRFFGQHDRAWIPLSGCYLISKDLPLPIKNKKKSKAVGLRGGLDGAMQEMQVYIDNIKKIIGEFEYAPPRTLLTHCDLYRKTSLTAVKTEKKDDNQDSVSSFYKNYTTQQSTEKSKTRNERKSSKDGNGDEVTAQTVISAKLDGSIEKASKDGKIGVLSPSSSKKSKMVTTSGEHPVKSMATKKRRASMAFLTKTIESCKASLGIEKLQDVQMNSGSEDTTSSSDDDENDVDGEEKAEGADKKKEQMVTEGTSTQALPEPKQNSDEDDSDAELVIDLGDIEDTVEPSTAAKEEEEKSACTKADDKSDGIAAKKRKLETASGDKPNAPKVPLKSILVSTSKPAVASDEQKKLLVKALSEKIGNLKRKHDIDTSPSGSSPSHKSRKTNESLDSRSRSPQDPIQKLQKQSGHQKDKKKLHHVSKYPEKDSSGKRKESLGSSEKRISDSGKKLPSSIKHRSGKTETEIGSVKAGFKDPYQKTQSKKLVNSDKGGKIDKIPTGADTRKLFNGGRIPRKNPVNFSDDDTNDKDNEAKDNTMDTTQIDFQSHRKSTESTPSTKRLNGDSRKHIYDKDVNGVTFESMKKYTDRVMEGVQKVFYDMYTEMIAPMRTVVSSGTSSNAEAEAAAATALNQVSQIRLELERQKWMHDQEIAELKHNHDLTVAEIRQSLENEKKQLLLDARMQGEADRIKAIEETKKKQWCAQCGREAIFYCCWNTSYCDYPCQQKHWVQHMNSCTQAREAPDCKTPTSIKSPPTTVGHSIHSSTTSVKAIVTFSKSLSNTSTAGSKATVVLPSSLQIAKPTSTIIKSSMKNQSLPPTDSSVKATASETSTDHAEKSVQKSEKTSGLTISAIGARLLAEKQKSTDTTTLVSSSISTTDSNDHSTVTTSALVHVKTTLESPLSPDIKPASPTASLSAVDKNLEKKPVFEPISSSQCVTSTPSKVKVVLPLSSVSSAQSKVKYFTSVGNSGKLPLVDPMSASFKLLQASKAIKKQPASTILTFSSPSAVASLITEMESPLSSTLSSSPGDSSSSLANTPEKPKTTAETAKIQISQSGSAFTKVIPDSSKHTTVPDVPKMSKGDTATTQPSISKKPTTVHSSVISTTSSFKPVDTFKTITASSKESTGSETSEPVPLVKPVLADNFLTTLQKTLSKVGTSQKQVMSGTSPKLTKSSEELQGSELTPGVEKEKMETSS